MVRPDCAYECMHILQCVLGVCGLDTMFSCVSACRIWFLFVIWVLYSHIVQGINISAISQIGYYMLCTLKEDQAPRFIVMFIT